MDFAGRGASKTTKLDIYSLGLTSLASLSATAPGTGHSTWSPGVTQSGGLIFYFGPDALNAGIDNLTFTIGNATAPVPEPATWALMIAGFGAIGATMRSARKSAATRAAA